MWSSNWLVVLAGHAVPSPVRSAGCLECQLVYSSNSVAPSCETVPLGAACIGISPEIYCPIWEGCVCACVCHKRELASQSTVLIFTLLKENHDGSLLTLRLWVYRWSSRLLLLVWSYILENKLIIVEVLVVKEIANAILNMNQSWLFIQHFKSWILSLYQ